MSKKYVLYLFVLITSIFGAAFSICTFFIAYKAYNQTTAEDILIHQFIV